MATHCLIPLLGKMLRVTELDSCGVPVSGGFFVATDGFVSITLSSEVEDGTEIIVRKASGALCVNEKMADSFKRFTVELHLCGVNPSLLGIMSNANPYYDGAAPGGDIIGFTVPEGEIKKWFSLELWTGLSGQACAPGAEEASGYILLPFVTAGVLGDIEITGEDAIDFSITGAATKGGNAWGVGPYDVVMDDLAAPGPLPVAIDTFDHLLMIDTALAPPPSACDPQPIPDGAVTLSTFPDGEPTESWTVAQIDAYAAERGINLGGASTKAEKLAAIEAASVPA